MMEMETKVERSVVAGLGEEEEGALQKVQGNSRVDRHVHYLDGDMASRIYSCQNVSNFIFRCAVCCMQITPH